MLNLERLRVLHTVSATGSVVGAARVLHVTTSAISQQMARLERETGQRLAERHGRGIRLTEAGQLLARNAGHLLAQAEQVEAAIAGCSGTVTGTLNIAAFATAARGLLPGALQSLRSRYPDLSVSLSEQEPHEAVPALNHGDLDVAVVQDWTGDTLAVPGGLSRLNLMEDPFEAALHTDHPLADRVAITLPELAAEDWISWSTGQICHDWLIRMLRTDGTEPRILHSASEHSTQLALVAAGLGIALIPRLGREFAPPSVRFVPLDPPPVRCVFALWRTSSAARPAIQAALNALKDCSTARNLQRGEVSLSEIQLPGTVAHPVSSDQRKHAADLCQRRSVQPDPEPSMLVMRVRWPSSAQFPCLVAAGNLPAARGRYLPCCGRQISLVRVTPLASLARLT